MTRAASPGATDDDSPGLVWPVVTDCVDLGELAAMVLRGPVIEGPDGEPAFTDPTAPGAEALPVGTMTLAEALGPTPPYVIGEEWLRQHRPEGRLLACLDALAHAVAWADLDHEPGEGSLRLVIGAERHRVALPTSWPTPRLSCQGLQVRARLDGIIRAASREVDHLWEQHASDAWAIATLLVSEPRWHASRVGRQWVASMIACVDPTMHRFDDPALRATAAEAVEGLPAHPTTIDLPDGIGRALGRHDLDRPIAELVEGLVASTLTPWRCWRMDRVPGQPSHVWRARLPAWCADLITRTRPGVPQMNLTVAGAAIPDAHRLLEAYCGLTGHVWAYPYYDQMPLDDGEPSRLDLLTAAVMHGPIRKADLEWYESTRPAIGDLLADLPGDVDLADAPAALCDRIADGVAALTEGRDGAIRGLLTKILHRRRPRLVPIDERDIAKRYATAHGRPGRMPYRELLTSMATDLADDDNVRALTEIGEHLSRTGLAPLPTDLRTLDIATWMHANP